MSVKWSKEQWLEWQRRVIREELKELSLNKKRKKHKIHQSKL